VLHAVHQLERDRQPVRAARLPGAGAVLRDVTLAQTGMRCSSRKAERMGSPFCCSWTRWGMAGPLRLSSMTCTITIWATRLAGTKGDLVGSLGGQPEPRRRIAAPACVVWALPPGGCLSFPFPQPFAEGRLALAPAEGLLAFTDGVVGAPHSAFGDPQLATFLT